MRDIGGIEMPESLARFSTAATPTAPTNGHVDVHSDSVSDSKSVSDSDLDSEETPDLEPQES